MDIGNSHIHLVDVYSYIYKTGWLFPKLTNVTASVKSLVKEMSSTNTDKACDNTLISIIEWMCNLTLKIDVIGLIQVHAIGMTVYFPRVLPLPNGTGIHMHAVLTLHIMLRSMMACHCHPVMGM